MILNSKKEGNKVDELEPRINLEKSEWGLEWNENKNEMKNWKK